MQAGGFHARTSRVLLKRKLGFKPFEMPPSINVEIPFSFDDKSHVVNGRSKMHILQAIDTERVRRGLAGLTRQNKKLERTARATGRIGFPQRGKPTEKDKSMGTGFLISPNHIMTNRHVLRTHKFFSQTNIKRDKVGIEFGAEKDSTKSDFYAFSEDYEVFKDLDLVILELKQPVLDRDPVVFDFSKTDKLEDEAIAVIGYPDPTSRDERILSVVEDDPLWGIKRISTGKIFRHSTDNDDVFGVLVPSVYAGGKGINSICHTASTAGGSSGSPVVMRSNGKVCAVHFGQDRLYNDKEAANFAMSAISFSKQLKRLRI